MEEYIYFSNFVTKNLQPINSEDRYFEGYLTVQVKDKQGEITIVDELYKVLPIWMDRGAPISDTHSNRIIGKGINYAKTEYIDKDGTKYPAIKITGKIHKNYELDNEIWQKIKSGEYKGLSFGGATRTSREPVVMKDGSIAYALKELEHYEVAVCKDPAVPLALITDHNTIAKAMAGYTEDRGDKMLIQCSKFGCYINKKELIKDPIGEPLGSEKPFKLNPDKNPKNYSKLEEIINDDKIQTREAERDGTKLKTGGMEIGCPNGDCNYKFLSSQRDDPKKPKFCPSCGNHMSGINKLRNPNDNISNDDNKKKSQEIGTANAGGTRFSGKEYNQGGEQTTQITEVQNPEEDEERKIGMKVETAFTEDKKEAEDSVENHLKKDPKHYSKLKDVFDGIEKADEDKPLNKPMRDDGDKKFKVYVKDPNTGKIVIVRFGDPNMEIKRDDPERRASFRARHDCDNAKDITTPKYWSCKMWEKETSVTDQIDKTNREELTEKEKEQKQFAMGEELEAIQYQLGSKKDIDDSLLIKSKNKTLDETKKAFKIVEKIVPLIAQAILPMLTGGGEEEEEVEKADLSKLSTFKGKEQALIDEGKSKESAEKIVGSFVKHENKADASMSSTTEGANNPRYSDPDPEDDNPETIMNRAKVVGTKQEMYKSQEKEFDEESGQSHANTNGDGNQGSQDVGRQSWAGSGSPYPKIIDESRKNKIKSINLDCNILKNKLKRL